jgi:putative acyl-CoA dehydrogenase
VNAIWEGSGNVIALDLVRAMAREPGSVDALQKELEAAKGADRRLDLAIDSALESARNPSDAEYEARRLTEGLALATGGALLARHARPEVWEGFAASRLAADRGGLYGTLPPGVAVDDVVEAAIPRP